MGLGEARRGEASRYVVSDSPAHDGARLAGGLSSGKLVTAASVPPPGSAAVPRSLRALTDLSVGKTG